MPEKNRGSPCSFKRKGEFHSVIELSLREICYVLHVHALADDAKIVRSRYAQCNTKELPKQSEIYKENKFAFYLNDGRFQNAH